MRLVGQQMLNLARAGFGVAIIKTERLDILVLLPESKA